MEDGPKGPKKIWPSQNIWTLSEHQLHYCKNYLDLFYENLAQIKYLTEIEVGLLIGGVISKWDCHDTRSRIENWSKKHDMGSSNIFHEMCYFNHLRFIMGPKSFWTQCLISILPSTLHGMQKIFPDISFWLFRAFFDFKWN